MHIRIPRYDPRDNMVGMPVVGKRFSALLTLAIRRIPKCRAGALCPKIPSHKKTSSHRDGTTMTRGLCDPCGPASVARYHPAVETEIIRAVTASQAQIRLVRRDR